MLCQRRPIIYKGWKINVPDRSLTPISAGNPYLTCKTLTGFTLGTDGDSWYKSLIYRTLKGKESKYTVTSLKKDVKKCSLYAFQVYTLLDRYPRTHPCICNKNLLKNPQIKGSLTQDFRVLHKIFDFRVLSWIRFPPGPLIYHDCSFEFLRKFE